MELFQLSLRPKEKAQRPLDTKIKIISISNDKTNYSTCGQRIAPFRFS